MQLRIRIPGAAERKTNKIFKRDKNAKYLHIGLSYLPSTYLLIS